MHTLLTENNEIYRLMCESATLVNGLFIDLDDIDDDTLINETMQANWGSKSFNPHKVSKICRGLYFDNYTILVTKENTDAYRQINHFIDYHKTRGGSAWLTPEWNRIIPEEFLNKPLSQWDRISAAKYKLKKELKVKDHHHVDNILDTLDD